MSRAAMQVVEKVAEAVLYEGYLLFPYRRSALKNQQRWTFGGVYPQHYSEENGGDDPWSMQTECLVLGNEQTTIEVTVRFLQVAERTVAQRVEGGLAPVESLRVGEQVYQPWEEAIERTIALTGPEEGRSLRLGDLLERTHTVAIEIPEGSQEELLHAPSGWEAGVLIRRWCSLSGSVEVSAAPLSTAADGVSGYRLSVRIANHTPFANTTLQPASRQKVLAATFVSTHTIICVQDGEFVSLLEPAPLYQQAAECCRNIGTWPVLVGEPGERHTLLSSPIILYDYPQVSPESPGNLFDATEIDELLTLSILTLTDEEKQEMRDSDVRGREILERTEALTPDRIMQLHAAVRSLQNPRKEVS